MNVVRAGFEPGGPAYGQRRSRVRVYFCCCPLSLCLALPLLCGYLIKQGALRVLRTVQAR